MSTSLQCTAEAIVQRQQASANEQGAWRNISWTSPCPRFSVVSVLSAPLRLDDLFARERQERGKAAVFSLERKTVCVC